MANLVKSDLKRVLKDRMMIIILIIAAVFALITPLLYAALFLGTDMNGMEMMPINISAKSCFFGSFSFGNNIGLIAPVLLAIILRKDFSHGTIRNKIIAGKSRTSIFASMFIVCTIVLVGIILFHAFLTLGISLIFFDYQSTPFSITDFWYFLESLAFGILLLLFISSFVSWLCATMKNVGMVIVLYVAVSFLLSIIASVIAVVLAFMQTSGGSETTVEILEFINRINVANAASYIGAGSSYTITDVLYLTIPSLVGIAAFLGFGLLKFKKRDLK